MPTIHPPRRDRPPAPSVDRDKWVAMVEAEADEALRIGPRMARALRALISFSGPQGCFPSIQTVAAAADVSENTLREGIRRAVALGYLQVSSAARHITVQNGKRLLRQSPNSYTFHLPAEAVPSHQDGKAWRAQWWQRRRTRLAEERDRRGGSPGCRVGRGKNAEESLSSVSAGAPPIPRPVDNWSDQVAGAAQQLAALGFPLPAHWNHRPGAS